MKLAVAVSTLCLLAAVPRAQTPVPLENVISYWTGAGNPGTGRRLDGIGSNHLWGSADSSDVAGKVDMATAFTGDGQLHTTLRTDTYASSITAYGREITYAGWIQVDSLQDDQIIASRWGRWAPSREFRVYYSASAGVLQMDWSDSGNVDEQTVADDLDIEADTWYFVAFGRSASTGTVWLSVTPDTAAAPRTAVSLGSVPANPDGAGSDLWFGYDQGSKSNCYGMWDEWGVYDKTLGTGELAWLYNGGTGRTFDDFEYVVEPTLEFFHDMEQEEPARGRISYYSYSEPNAFLSSEQAAGGSRSLKIIGDWGQIQLFNDTNTDYWCPIDRCRVSMDVYVVDFAAAMLFQLDGKTSSSLTDLDTNEGLGKVQLHTRNGERGITASGVRTSGYNLPLNQWVHIDFLRDRWRTAPDNSMELYVDGELILSTPGEEAPFEPEPYVAEAWHHISLGNDLAVTATFYIDNFEVAPEPWGTELAVRPMSSLTATVGETLTLSPTVTGAGATAVYAWTAVSGSDSLTIGTPDAAQTDVVFSGAGSFELQLAVVDSGDTATGTVSVEVSSAAQPYDPLELQPMDSLTAVVGETLDVLPEVTGGDGARTYAWIRVGGPDSVVFGNAAAGTTTVRFDAPGTYGLQLTVIAGTDTVTGTLTAVVTAPVGIFVPGPAGTMPQVVMSSNLMQSGIRFMGVAEITGMAIYDRTGRVVYHSTTVRTGRDPSAGSGHGLSVRTWNGHMVSGRPAPAGTYFYRITTDAGTATGSFIKIK